jgi:hypothetical protein
LPAESVVNPPDVIITKPDVEAAVVTGGSMLDDDFILSEAAGNDAID